MALMNISGLASGLDTDQIIQQLLDIERVPLTRLQTRQATTTVVKGVWSEIANRLSSLNSRLTDLKLSTTFTSRTATSSAENVLTATATSSAEQTAYSVNVQQVARAHSLASDPLKVWTTALEDDLSTDAGFSLTGDAIWYAAGGQVQVPYNDTRATSGSLISQNASLLGEATHIRVNWDHYQSPPDTQVNYFYSTDDGVSWTAIAQVEEGTDIALAAPASAVKFKAEFSNNQVVTYPFLTYYQVEALRQISSSELDTALGLAGGFSFHLQSDPGQTASVAIELTDSATAIRDKINQAALDQGIAVQASIIDNRLVLTSGETGSQGAIVLTDGPEGVLADLGLLDGGGVVKNELVAASDAVIDVNGITGITRSSNSISDVIAGVTLNLKEAGAADLTVALDSQKAKDAIQAFLDQYNSTMDYIAAQLGEAGELRGDVTLVSIQNSLRRLATTNVAGVTGSYKSLIDLGIGTGAVSTELTYDKAGKLSISDSGKLDSALAADPAGVYALFDTAGESGLAVQLSNYISGLTRSGDGVITARQDGLDRLNKDLTEQVERLNDRLAREEERLRNQFTALEKALSVLQNQGNWLAGQIATLQGLQQQR